MTAIFKREFKSLFQNVIGWLFVGIILAIYGLYFFANNISSGSPSISNTLSGIVFIFMFAVPILSMRSLTEDRKNKTDQLIFTSPVSVFKIVFGKYLSLAATFSITMVVVSLSPLFLRLFGTVSLAENYTAIFGFWIFGLTSIAVCFLISAFTESQIIAAVVSFFVLLLGFMMPGITSLISSDGNLVTKVMGCYDLVTPLDEFLNGSFSFVSLIYYISLIALCIFLTCQVILKRRWTVSSKKLSFSVFSGAAIILAFVICIAVNVFVTKIPDSMQSVDVTQKKMYSLTDATKKYLKTMNKDVTIYVLNTKSATDSTMKKTLAQYEALDKHITVTYVNTKKNPSFASKYSSDSLTAGSLIVVSKKKSDVINYENIFESTVDYSTYQSTVTGYDGEGQITSALQSVTTDVTPTVYTITGHGETEFAGNFSDVLTKANVTTKDLNLMDESAIPEDATAVIINGPTSDFSKDDAAKIDTYISAGKKIMITLNYSASMSTMPNFAAILSKYGISAADGVVVENDSSKYYSSPLYLLPTVASTDITGSLTNYIFAPDCVGMTAASNSVATITPVLTTSDSSVAKVTSSDGTIDSTTAADGDKTGPFDVGLTATINGSKTTSLYVFGSNVMFTDDADNYVSGTNSNMFSEVVKAMTVSKNTKEAIVVKSKSYSNTTLTFSARAVIWYGLIWSIFIPIVLIIAGIVVFAVRRSGK